MWLMLLQHPSCLETAAFCCNWRWVWTMSGDTTTVEIQEPFSDLSHLLHFISSFSNSFKRWGDSDDKISTTVHSAGWEGTSDILYVLEKSNMFEKPHRITLECSVVERPTGTRVALAMNFTRYSWVIILNCRAGRDPMERWVKSLSRRHSGESNSQSLVPQRDT